MTDEEEEEEGKEGKEEGKDEGRRIHSLLASPFSVSTQTGARGCFLGQINGRATTMYGKESSQEAPGRRYTGPPCRSAGYFIPRAEPQMARTSTLGYR